MINILFVCHGNICRSPMAEFVMKNLIQTANLSGIFVDSKATSREEIGNPPHHKTIAKLNQNNIPFSSHKSTQITPQDYDKFDYILCMDEANIANSLRIFGSDPQNKIRLLLSFTGKNANIADPYYTGNFDQTYDDILASCTAFIDILKQKTS